MNEWRTVFWITFAVFVVTTVIYCIWASGDLQAWNDPIKMKLMKEGGTKDLEGTDLGTGKGNSSKEDEANNATTIVTKDDK